MIPFTIYFFLDTWWVSHGDERYEFTTSDDALEWIRMTIAAES